MGFEATDRRAYLQGLRERAVERMRADEAEVRPVSRRDSLRWLGLGAMAVVAAKPMRAMEATGMLRARSEMSGSLRYPAPQYGVPAMPLPSVPFEIADDGKGLKAWGSVAEIAESRAELGDVKRWTKDYVTLIPPDGKMYQYADPKTYDAKVILYRPEGESKAHALAVVASHASGRTYAIAGGQQFYTEDADGLWSFAFDGYTLVVRRSLLEVKGADEESMEKAIHELAKKTKDAQLGHDAGLYAEIDTSQVMRGGGSGGSLMMYVSVKDGRADMQSYSMGRFVVDWRTKKVTYPVTP